MTLCLCIDPDSTSESAATIKEHKASPNDPAELLRSAAAVLVRPVRYLGLPDHEELESEATAIDIQPVSGLCLVAEFTLHSSRASVP